jgi:hypothetical protein
MAQSTLRGPMYNSQEFNTGDAPERGQSPKEIIDALNTMLSEIYGAAVTGVSPLQYVDVVVSPA